MRKHNFGAEQVLLHGVARLETGNVNATRPVGTKDTNLY